MKRLRSQGKQSQQQSGSLAFDHYAGLNQTPPVTNPALDRLLTAAPLHLADNRDYLIIIDNDVLLLVQYNLPDFIHKKVYRFTFKT